MLRRRLSVPLLMLIAWHGNGAAAATFPVRTEKAAIAIAKDVCLNRARILDENGKDVDIKSIFPKLHWVISSKTHNAWNVGTEITCAQRHALDVEVPINGPYPKICREDLYFIPGMQCPDKPHPR